MALFLQESVKEVSVEEISIEEAYEGLIEASMDMQDLTEGLLQADFIIHEECKVLTEAEGESKKANFLVRAVKAIKAFILKVRDSVVAFFTKVAAMLKASWDKLFNDDKIKTVVVPEGSIEAVNEVTKSIEELQKASSNESSTAKVLKADIAKKTAAVKQNMSKLDTILDPKTKEKTKIVPVASLKGIFQLTMMLAATGIAVRIRLSKRAAKLDEGISKVETIQKVAETTPTPENKMSLEDAFKAMQEENDKSKEEAKANLVISKNTGKVSSFLGNLKRIGGK